MITYLQKSNSSYAQVCKAVKKMQEFVEKMKKEENICKTEISPAAAGQRLFSCF